MAAKQETASTNWRVRIRMYRKWLGDCFLLSFRNGEGLSHVLIDCGALQGIPDGRAKLREATRQIHTETGGRLDALVVTHEHWDHVSGFSEALDLFQQFKVGEVWAAWTEDAQQKPAQESKTKIRNHFMAIRLALQRLSQSDSSEDRLRGAALASTLGFFPTEPSASLDAISTKTDAAMKAALSLGKNTFLDPGDVVERDWLPGVRVYVLGPPRDTAALGNTRDDGKAGMHGVRNALADAAEMSFVSAAAAGPSAGEVDRYAPFDRYLQWGTEEWSAEWPELAKSYAAEPKRRMDSDWLNVAAELALQLDNYTNNTSLVLAFELAGTNEVLLFTGDAQIGSWLSWTGVKFPAEGESRAPTAAQLLSRAIFYKVGHHGSHNATLQPDGLESMRSPGLVAAIPVDEEFAREPKPGCPGGWQMPDEPLLKALTERTKGRVLRADRDLPNGGRKPDALTEAEWIEFCRAVHFDEHYVEYRIG